MNKEFRLLCLSNGHGEDVIAVRILQALQEFSADPDSNLGHTLEMTALPLVGEGHAYTGLDIPLIGSVQTMPSGGFIYMDARQLMRDVRGGLLQLTMLQHKAIRRWAKQGGFILAVGDIVPLLFAWLSGLPYAFVGTAKSEYYLRDEAGLLPRKSRAQRWEGWSGSVYLPWERWLMSRPRCKAVFPRDQLTTKVLQNWSIPALDMGNPMMDGLLPPKPQSLFYSRDAELQESQRVLTITLLPGSREPEAYANWQLMLQAVAGVIESFWGRTQVQFLAAIAPGLSLDFLSQLLADAGWHPKSLESTPGAIQLNDSAAMAFTQRNATLVLSQHAFSECLHQGDLAIAMAGTATEQFVGLGKPAIAMPGKGPQFTPAFAESYTRLLGPSFIMVQQPSQVAGVIQSLLRDPDRLQLIADNGHRRMGEPGAAKRIASCLLEQMAFGGF